MMCLFFAVFCCGMWCLCPVLRRVQHGGRCGISACRTDLKNCIVRLSRPRYVLFRGFKTTNPAAAIAYLRSVSEEMTELGGKRDRLVAQRELLKVCVLC